MSGQRPLSRLIELATRRPALFVIAAALVLASLALLAAFRAQYDAHAPAFVYGRF